MRVIAFGIYSTEPHYPRFRNLLEGLRRNGVEVVECHYSMRGSFAERMASVKTATGSAGFALGLLASYAILTVQFLRAPAAAAVLVGYPGYFHVHLARFLKVFRNRRAPLVYDLFFSLHDTLVSDRKLLKPAGLAARAALLLDMSSCRAADRVLLDTASHARFITRQLGFGEEKMAVVPAGSTFPPAEGTKPAGARSPGLRVVFVGTYIPLHGIEVILEAARILILRGRDDIRFTLAGSGQLREELQDRAMRDNLSNVEFLDWVRSDELLDFLSSADVALGIFGTTEKARNVIPIKVYDICAAGAPLITADTPAIRESFIHGENAYLVPPGDPGALADAILALDRDGDLRDRIAAGAQRLYKTAFSSMAIGARVVEIINSSS